MTLQYCGWKLEDQDSISEATLPSGVDANGAKENGGPYERPGVILTSDLTYDLSIKKIYHKIITM